METEICCITYFPLMFLAYFVLLKVLEVSYFINSLFKKKNVKKMIQVSIKISKINFSVLR